MPHILLEDQEIVINIAHTSDYIRGKEKDSISTIDSMTSSNNDIGCAPLLPIKI